MTKEMIVTAELREGISRNTNEPYRFYVYYIDVNGVKVYLKPESRLAGDILSSFVDSQ